MSAFARHDEGQALVLIAIGMTVALLAAAIAIDWTYGLAQRRVMQNAADAAVLAAGRYLAQSVTYHSGTTSFTASAEGVYCEAERFLEANPPASGSADLTVELGSGTTWTPAPPSACPPTTTTAVPADTIYVRVTATTTVATRAARVFGVTTVPAGATARARLSGTPPVALPSLPLVQEFAPALYDCGGCLPGSPSPVTIWSINDDSSTQHGFKGLVDFSRYSSRHDPQQVEQLVTGWDRSGSPEAGTSPKPDRSGHCGGWWNTKGGEDPNQQNRQCSGTNWQYYFFQGALSTTTSWSHPHSPGQIVPSNLPPSRSVCAPGVRPPLAPSCEPGQGRVGDWVETITSGGSNDITGSLSDVLSDRGVMIIDPKAATPLSNTTVQSGPNRGRLHGKAIRIVLYLWDCAEVYSGGQWSLIQSNGDCSRAFAPGDPTPDRVHLFTIASYTVYQGLVSSNTVQGYFGGVLTDPTACQTCPLNPFANGVYLAAED